MPVLRAVLTAIVLIITTFFADFILPEMEMSNKLVAAIIIGLAATIYEIGISPLIGYLFNLLNIGVLRFLIVIIHVLFYYFLIKLVPWIHFDNYRGALAFCFFMMVASYILNIAFISWNDTLEEAEEDL